MSGWGKGDQAMCVRAPEAKTARQKEVVARIGHPKVPLIYEVVDVRVAPPELVAEYPQLEGMIYLGLREFRHAYWPAPCFRKLEPLTPEEIDLVVDLDEPVAA